jgi:MYXO-CTERM domain-containing protein
MNARARKNRVARLAGLLALLFTTAPGYGVCVFDPNGTIGNPDDPSCRDPQFELSDSTAGPGFLTLGYPVPMPVDSMIATDGFRSYASLHAQHQALFLGSNNIQGSIVGQTLAGRDIWAYTLGDPDALTVEGQPEAAVMINGGIHAREWQSPEVVTEILEQLDEISADGGFGQYLAENLNVVIVPVLNIDGFLQSQRFPSTVTATLRQPRDGRMRRKNMRRPSGGALVDENISTSDDQFDGVDLNRNSEHGFGMNNGSSSNPVSLAYRGPSFGSEPEIQALIQAATLAPGDRLRFYVDAHSFTQQFFVPVIGSTRRIGITQELAQRVSAVSDGRYAVSNDTSVNTIGTTADYFAVEYEIPTWTLEIEPRRGGQDYGGTGQSHSGFVLPDSEIERVRDEVTLMTLLGYYRQSGPPSVKAVEISRVSDGAVVLRADWQPVSGSTMRELTVSVDESLEAGADYNLWVAFNKPMRYSEDGVVAIQYPGQDAPGIGAVSLDAGSEEADAQYVVEGDLSNWLSAPGGAPEGYDTYRFDAFAVQFTAPTLAAPATLALALAVRDLSQLELDANPATMVGWQSGVWTGYEDALGNEGDDGGSDCSVTVRVTPDGMTAAAPGQSVACKAAFEAPPAPAPPVEPTPPPVDRGGGGALGLLGLLALLGARRRRL